MAAASVMIGLRPEQDGAIGGQPEEGKEKQHPGHHHVVWMDPPIREDVLSSSFLLCTLHHQHQLQQEQINNLVVALKKRESLAHLVTSDSSALSSTSGHLLHKAGFPEEGLAVKENQALSTSISSLEAPPTSSSLHVVIAPHALPRIRQHPDDHRYDPDCDDDSPNDPEEDTGAAESSLLRATAISSEELERQIHMRILESVVQAHAMHVDEGGAEAPLPPTSPDSPLSPDPTTVPAGGGSRRRLVLLVLAVVLLLVAVVVAVVVPLVVTRSSSSSTPSSEQAVVQGDPTAPEKFSPTPTAVRPSLAPWSSPAPTRQPVVVQPLTRAQGQNWTTVFFNMSNSTTTATFDVTPPAVPNQVYYYQIPVEANDAEVTCYSMNDLALDDQETWRRERHLDSAATNDGASVGSAGLLLRLNEPPNVLDSIYDCGSNYSENVGFFWGTPGARCTLNVTHSNATSTNLYIALQSNAYVGVVSTSCIFAQRLDLGLSSVPFSLQLGDAATFRVEYQPSPFLANENVRCVTATNSTQGPLRLFTLWNFPPNIIDTTLVLNCASFWNSSQVACRAFDLGIDITGLQILYVTIVAEYTPVDDLVLTCSTAPARTELSLKPGVAQTFPPMLQGDVQNFYFTLDRYNADIRCSISYADDGRADLLTAFDGFPILDSPYLSDCRSSATDTSEPVCLVTPTSTNQALYISIQALLDTTNLTALCEYVVPPVPIPLTDGVPTEGLSIASGYLKHFSYVSENEYDDITCAVSANQGTGDVYLRWETMASVNIKAYECEGPVINLTHYCTASPDASNATLYATVYSTEDIAGLILTCQTFPAILLSDGVPSYPIDLVSGKNRQLFKFQASSNASHISCNASALNGSNMTMFMRWGANPLGPSASWDCSSYSEEPTCDTILFERSGLSLGVLSTLYIAVEADNPSTRGVIMSCDERSIVSLDDGLAWRQSTMAQGESSYFSIEVPCAGYEAVQCDAVWQGGTVELELQDASCSSFTAVSSARCWLNSDTISYKCSELLSGSVIIYANIYAIDDVKNVSVTCASIPPIELADGVSSISVILPEQGDTRLFSLTVNASFDGVRCSSVEPALDLSLSMKWGGHPSAVDVDCDTFYASVKTTCSVGFPKKENEVVNTPSKLFVLVRANSMVQVEMICQTIAAQILYNNIPSASLALKGGEFHDFAFLAVPEVEKILCIADGLTSGEAEIFADWGAVVSFSVEEHDCSLVGVGDYCVFLPPDQVETLYLAVHARTNLTDLNIACHGIPPVPLLSGISFEFQPSFNGSQLLSMEVKPPSNAIECDFVLKTDTTEVFARWDARPNRFDVMNECSFGPTDASEGCALFTPSGGNATNSSLLYILAFSYGTITCRTFAIEAMPQNGSSVVIPFLNPGVIEFFYFDVGPNHGSDLECALKGSGPSSSDMFFMWDSFANITEHSCRRSQSETDINCRLLNREEHRLFIAVGAQRSVYNSTLSCYEVPTISLTLGESSGELSLRADWSELLIVSVNASAISSVQCVTMGLSGQVQMYVHWRSAPMVDDASSYDCSSKNSGVRQACTVQLPEASGGSTNSDELVSLFVRLYAFTDYESVVLTCNAT